MTYSYQDSTGLIEKSEGLDLSLTLLDPDNPIYSRDNFIDPLACLNLHETLRLYRARGLTFQSTVYSETNQAIVDPVARSSHGLRILPEFKQYFDKLNAAADDALAKYTMDRYTLTPHHDQVLIYEEGDNFREHADDSIKVNGRWVRNDPERDLVAILYLADSTDDVRGQSFGGGEIVFDNIAKDGKPLAIAPEPGLLLIFPANPMFLHRVNPVTKGTRTLITRWWTKHAA